MDLYNFFLGVLFFIGGFLFMIKEMTNTKKSIDMFRIQMFGALLGFILLGLWLMYSELMKLL